MAGYPCRFCGDTVHGRQDGRGFKVGSYRFVTCLRCAPKVETAADVTKRLAVAGLRALAAKKAPMVLAVVEQALRPPASEAPPPIEVRQL